MKSALILSSLMAVLAMPALVNAHGGATGVVHDRMEAMKDMKAAMKNLKPVFAGSEAWQGSMVSQEAARIVKASGQHMLDLFPQGSNHKPSEAKAQIWQEWETFSTGARNLERVSKILQSVAAEADGYRPATLKPRDLKTLRLEAMTDAQLSAMPAADLYMLVGSTCRSCHERYKAD